MGNVYLFLADGFEEIEALTVVDVLRRAGLSVRTVGVGTLKPTGAHGIAVSADLSEADVDPDTMSAVVLPGGMPGTKNLEMSATVLRTLDLAVSRGLLVAAICAAPSILGHAGYLRDKRATCYPGFESALLGADVKSESVVECGQFITANGPGAAMAFAFAVLARLTDTQTAEKIKGAMQCQNR